MRHHSSTYRFSLSNISHSLTVASGTKSDIYFLIIFIFFTKTKCEEAEYRSAYYSSWEGRFSISLVGWINGNGLMYN